MKIIKVILLLFIVNTGFAQIQHGGLPPSMDMQEYALNIPLFVTPNTNVEALRLEDETIDQIKDIPWRYGYIHYVDLGLEDGFYSYLPNGDRIWRIKIASDNAQTINLTFDKYKLVPGAMLFVYNTNYSNVLGSFTNANNKDHGYLTTTLIEGEEVTIELYEPKGTFNQNQLHLERIVHGYRSMDYKNKNIGDSGTCNNNVVCPVGDDWRDQIRSVGILLNQNNLAAGFCTGALINNTCDDGTPYFLTANHCSANDPTTVVGFNFESTACNTNSGPYMNQTISGVTHRASNAASDFMLLELSSTPPAEYNVFYSGWDRSGTTTNGQVGIHHPAGDLKKISFDTDPATQQTYSSAFCWEVGNWEDGTTEGGSSGSPLYNLNGNIIGQLYGGSASCQSITSDNYGRFDVSWNNGSGPGDELQSWLDACNTGVTELAGYDPNAIVLNEDAYLGFRNTPTSDICGSKIEQKLVLRNRGVLDLTSATITYGLDGSVQTYNWTGLLSSNQSEEILLDSLNLNSGLYQYEAYISSSNLNADGDLLNDTVAFTIDLSNGINVSINLATNFAADENSFEIVDENNNQVEFESGFGNNETYSFSYCLPLGSYCINFYDDGADGLSPTFFFDQGNYQLVVDGVEIINDDEIGTGFNYCVIRTGIQQAQNSFVSKVYPNPNNGSFTIESEEAFEKVEMLNVLGKVVYSEAINSTTAFIQTEQLTKGLYWIKVSGKTGSSSTKIVLK